MRQKYLAALVDEFQDTDSVQYDIFSRLFSDSESLLFMIGDPKQAIYSFRGADIFSYLQAARYARNKFTLTENWRSEPDLIKAVNALFSDIKFPFLFEAISFQPAQTADERSPAPGNSAPPMTIWYLDSRAYSGKNKPITKTAAVRIIAEAVAEEICRIAGAETNAWQPADIAVLVRTNRQARLVGKCLSARGIPSVLYSTGNIFDSREAMEIEKILLSISEPDNPASLKAALAMDMMGARGEALLSMDPNLQQWEDLLIRMREYGQLWQKSGFMMMFRILLNREHVRERLLSFSDGERRLTNILHLAEIINRESLQLNLGVRGTLKWLAEQRDDKSPRLEEHQLRLESDAQAVQIVTIHKSKGLEYPVVFCPYAWEGSFIRDSEIIYHRPHADGGSPCLTMDLGSDSFSENLIYAHNELLAENIRLLYVALTRAKTKCYLSWGRINTAESSALGYLLHSDDITQAKKQPADSVAALKKQLNAKSDEDRLADLSKLVKKSNGTIEVATLPETSDLGFAGQVVEAKSVSCRQFSGTIDSSWRVSSYSALVSRQMADVDMPDRDALGEFVRHLADTGEDPVAGHKLAARDTIFAFPKGARTGHFFHDIFEHLDYTAELTKASKKVIEHALQTYGFDGAWFNVVAGTIFNVLNVRLTTDRPEMTLASIDLKHRVNEMEFYFPLNRIRPSTLQNLFKRHGSIPGSDDFPVHMENLVFSPVCGFMKGYMDLVFKQQNRFYLVDWKSNYLGPTIDCYRQDALKASMFKHYYDLQYHLYSLALCQYLRLRKKDFQYETDFGGAFYIFIRGIDSHRDAQSGIFFDRPKKALINDLGKALIPGFENLK